MNKEIYVCNIEWKQTNEEFGGVKGEFVSKENVSYKDYEKLSKKDLFISDYNIQQENKKLKEENKQLKDNWNKLKEWIIDRQKRYFAFDDETLLTKIQELEKGDSNE